MARRILTTAAVTVAVLALAAAACGGGDDHDDEAAEAAGLAGQLEGSLQQSTLFTTQHALGVSVTYAGTHDDVRLATIQLDTPLFTPVEPQARDARLRTGGRALVMPLKYGDADCDVDPADAGPARLVAVVAGTDETVRLDLAEQPDDLLAGLHAAECEVQGVLDQVDVAFGDTWTRTAERQYETTIELAQRTEGTTATLTEMRGNVIFGVTDLDPGHAAGDPWAVVDDDHPTARVPLRVEAGRCDPHALTEYKRTFVLVAMISVGDADPVRIDVRAEGPAHDALATLLEACLPPG
jgi:hypothetical protein